MSRLIRKFLGVTLLAAAPAVLINGLTVLGDGPWSTAGIELLAIPTLLGFICAVIALIGTVFKAIRVKALSIASVSGGLFIGGVAGIVIGQNLRMYAFELASERAKPLVTAIRAFEEKNGVPPERLSLLVPTYIDEIPERLPPLEIIVGPAAQNGYFENPWALVAKVPGGLINWDIFIYLPNENYPEYGFDGSIERLGDWAYVHE